MIHRFVLHNGKLSPIEDVRLSPGQGGLLSGWGLFTTIRIVEGFLFAFERHWATAPEGTRTKRTARFAL